MPGRYNNFYGLICTFSVIKFAQFLAQPENLHPNNGIGRLIERLRPPENIRGNGILLNRVDVAFEISFAYVLEQAGQSRLLFKGPRGQHCP